MRRSVPVLIALPIMLVPVAWGQQAVSARAGLIQYVEGRVLLDGQEIAPKPNEFLQVEKDQTLATEDGRAEILLTPGAFLRLSENSSFRMISGSLSDTRVEVLSGSAMVEVEELLKDNAVTLQSGSTAISLKKHGLYRVDADGAANFKVYDGEAVITSADKTVTAKKGRQVQLDETLADTKFDTDATDPFYRWSERRAGYVATANVSSARSVMGSGSGLGSGLGYGGGGLGYGSGLGCNGLGYNTGYNTAVGYGAGYYGNNGTYPNTGCASLGYSGWTYNPWFGMYTYVPTSGFGYSPFGYAIYSPVTVRNVAVQTNGSFVPASTQRTISPPTLRTASTPGTTVLGRTGASSLRGGGSTSGGTSAFSSGGGSNGGSSSGTVAGRMSSSGGASSGGVSASGGGGARSSGGGARGR